MLQLSRIYWSITGTSDFNGFLLNITSSGLPTVTQQLTDSSVRAFIYGRILPERGYNIEIRGYYQLVGPASTITVRLEGIATCVKSIVPLNIIYMKLMYRLYYYLACFFLYNSWY